MSSESKYYTYILFIILDLAEDILMKVRDDIDISYRIKADMALLALKEWTKVPINTLRVKGVERFDKDKHRVYELLKMEHIAHANKCSDEFINYCQKFFIDKKLV